MQDYPGTVLLVSHDRAFLDNVVTQTLAAEGDGTWKEYVGGYSDWQAQRRPPPGGAAVAAAGERRPGSRAAAAGKPAKLSYKESRELEQLPGRLEALEAEQREISARMSGGEYHKQGAPRLRADAARIEAIEAELAASYERWAELDARAAR